MPGLLWTHTRAAYLALALGLVVLAAAQRRLLPVGARGRLARDRRRLRQGVPAHRPVDELHPERARVPARQGPAEPGVSDDPLSAGDASTSSHLRNLRDGIRTVVHHPLGFGLGNAGVSASRTGVDHQGG